MLRSIKDKIKDYEEKVLWGSETIHEQGMKLSSNKARIEDMGNLIADYRLKENKTFKYINEMESRRTRL